MANSTASFSVFPSTQVPRISVPNPHNRKPSLSSVLAKEMFGEESVVIKIEQHPVPKIPTALLAQHKLQASTLEVNQGRNVATPERDIKTIENGRQYVPKEYTPKPKGSPQPGSIGSSSTLVRSTTPDGQPKSPVIPIRSMFPVYNPNVSLADQHYYPQRPPPTHIPRVPTSKYSRQDLRTYLATEIDQELGARTAPSSVIDIPLDALHLKDTQLSSPRELDRLWEATHGTEPSSTVGSFNLEMARTSEATFTFGANPSTPFYSITTYDTSEIAITKTCPRKRSVTCDVTLTALESVNRRLPPADGLVTFIFPKMAAMLAVNQSNAIAEEHGLAPTHRDEVQAAAMKRAADQEASNLRYNYEHERYELEHPAVARKQRETNFVMSPKSPQDLPKPVLHIRVNKTIGRTSHGKPSITVTFPSAKSPTNSAGPGIRLSTMGQSETDCTLASLDFHSNILYIDANQILNLMPSLFAIDSIVSALLAVAIADHNTNVVMGNMDIWLPPPRGLGSPSGSAMSWGRGSYFATIAEREEAEAEAKAMQQLHKKDLKSNKKKSKSGRSWFGKSKSRSPKPKQPKQSKQIVVGEFDLEKLSHYQGGSRDGQELPGFTRALLGLMIGGLKFIVWFLTVLVQVLAWVLVRGTRCFTSEKF